jgi:gamma-glutamyltranspeptidase/glutathione hydrolase
MASKPKLTSVVSPNLSRRREVRKPAVRSRGGIVVAQNRIAAEVGARVLKAGGHAVDAAVATAFTVGVVEPWMSGIGGVGVMLMRDARSGKITGLDFGAVSPRALNPRDYPVVGGTDGNLFGWSKVKDDRNTTGPYAVCVPSEPLGLATAHRMWGRKKWKDLLQPAIRHAEDGLVVDWHTMTNITSALADLQRDPGAAKRFLRDRLPPMPPYAALAKDVVRLPAPDLAKTLASLASDGVESFYKGAIARSIAADIKAMGGSLAEPDLAGYAVRVVDQPLEITHGDRTVHLLPELNGGPTVAMAFAELQRIRKRPEARPGARTFTAYATALRHAWDYRLKHMGDAGERTAPTCTTHLTVVDRDGNMVTLTQTLLSLFGSRIVLPGTGILMNNGINWFDPIPGGPNAIAPGKRALSNYAPAIMTGGGETIAVGGCGGRKIIPAVFQILAQCADFGFDLETVFHQPRIDVSGTGPVAVDRRLGDKVIDAIADLHDTVVCEPVPFPFPFTIASAVRRAKGMNEGATEPEMPWSEAVSEDEV